MYLETVGRNATLILNIPPNKAGVLPDASVAALEGMGQLIKTRLGNDLAKSATIQASETRTAGAARTYVAANMTDGDKTTYWATNDGTTSATITLTWDDSLIDHLVKEGYSVTYGARNLRRLIQKQIEDAIAEKLIAGRNTKVSAICLSAAEGKVEIETKE